jgi:hypothetical protein
LASCCRSEPEGVRVPASACQICSIQFACLPDLFGSILKDIVSQKFEDTICLIARLILKNLFLGDVP